MEIVEHIKKLAASKGDGVTAITFAKPALRR